MKSAEDVCANLTYVFEGLRSGELKAAVAGEMNNACGKVINMAKLQLEYMKLSKQPTKIMLLEVSDGEEKPQLPAPGAKKKGKVAA